MEVIPNFTQDTMTEFARHRRFAATYVADGRAGNCLHDRLALRVAVGRDVGGVEQLVVAQASLRSKRLISGAKDSLRLSYRGLGLLRRHDDRLVVDLVLDAEQSLQVIPDSRAFRLSILGALVGPAPGPAWTWPAGDYGPNGIMGPGDMDHDGMMGPYHPGGPGAIPFATPQPSPSPGI